MPYLPHGFGAAAPVQSPVLLAQVQGPQWARYPSDWRRGLAAQIRPSATPAAQPPGWNLVPLNLAKMLKRMEQMTHPPLTPAELAVFGIDRYRRTS